MPIAELERQGVRDTTILIYIFGNNGASAEGQNGTLSGLLLRIAIPIPVGQQMAALHPIELVLGALALP